MLSSSRLSPTLLLQIPDDDSLHGFGTDQPNGFGADQPNGLSTSVEEVQLSEEELQKARDDFKVGMAPGRRQVYQGKWVYCSASFPSYLHSSDGIGNQRTISVGQVGKTGRHSSHFSCSSTSASALAASKAQA